ncbi:MAG: FkbM family methyltransferase, partial [Phycisphaerales bacterium]
MRLTAHDAFEMMSWVLDASRPLTIVDAGAHEGVVAAQMLRVFPRATVYAFEPIRETFETLSRRAETTPGIKPVHAALGDAPGTAEMFVNRHSMTTSLLPASERGTAYYGDWLECVRKERVEVVRLDAWAAREGIDAVHAMKIDVQGFEAPMLRGAERLLRESVVAVYSEAQLIPEYEGASTYSDIDLQLREYGFGLHQIVDVHFKGTLHETACCD